MANQPSVSDSFALASRFLNAFLILSKTLVINPAISRYEELNMSQMRILQLVHDNPGIRADVVIERLELTPQIAKSLMLAMEKMGLLALDRPSPEVPPALRLGEQVQRLAFHVKATQLSIVAELLGKLPEANRLITIEALEQLTLDN